VSDLLNFWWQWLPRLLDGYLLSFQVTGLSLLLGIPLGLALALGQHAKSAMVRGTILVVIEIGRGMPVLILLQLTYFGLPSTGLALSSFAAAVLALTLCTGAYASEIVRAALEAVPFGQKEAVAALGLSDIDGLRFVVLPQGLRVALPALLSFSIIVLQASSLCFAIALPELVSQAYGAGSSTFRYLSSFVLAGLLFATVCIPATLLASALDRRLRRHL